MSVLKKILAKEEFSFSSGINWPLKRLQTQSRSKTIYICLVDTAWLISSVHSLSRVWLCDPMDCSMPGFPVHHQLPEFIRTHVHWSVMPSIYLILCHPLLLLPSIFCSIRVFSNESVIWIRWLKYWSFSFSISPSNEYSGLISFRMDWLDLLAVQGTLKSLSNIAVQKHQFLGAQLSSQSNSHIHTWLLKKNQSFG